ADEGDVAAVDPSLADELLKGPVRLLRAGDDEQPRRAAIETVDDPGTLRHVSTCDAALEQGVHEGPSPVPGRRVDDDSGRLVDHEQVLVLIGDPQVPRLRLEVGLALLRNLDLEHLPALEPVALRPHRTVQADGSRRKQPLRLGARADLGKRGDETIEPLVRSCWGDAKALAHLEPVLASGETEALSVTERRRSGSRRRGSPRRRR